MTDTDRDHWSRFWQQGHITTFGASVADNYGGLARQFWESQFAGLGNGDTVLDVATGNGAIAVLAQQFAIDKGLDIRVLAADAAIINPTLKSGGDEMKRARDQVQFLSGVACEQLSVRDNSIDLLSSHLGIEYSDLDRSIPEVSRVLVDHGRFAAIIHNAGSMVIGNSRRELDVYAAAFGELAVFERLRDYFDALGDTPDPGALRAAISRPAMKPVAAALNEAVNALIRHFGDTDTTRQLVAMIRQAASGASMAPAAKRVRAIESIESDCQAAVLRLEDLVRAARDTAGMDQLRALTLQHGLGDTHVEEFSLDGGQVFGWTFTARRQAR